MHIYDHASTIMPSFAPFAHEATLLALLDTLFPGGDTLPATDSAELLARTRSFVGEHALLGNGLNALLRWLELRYFATHLHSFASASREQRLRFVEHNAGSLVSGNLLRLLSLPFRASYLLDEQVQQRIRGQYNVRVPAATETARWRSQVTEAASLSSDEELECDVIIVGSGAGGAAAAHELASHGLAVVIVEEGQYYDRRDFTGKLTDVIPKLYRNYGSTVAIGNSVIPIPVGCSVGGTTTINSGTAMRPTERLLQRWQQEGLSDFTEQEMAPYFEEVMDIIKVQPANIKFVGEIADVITRGGKALGLHDAHPLPRNAEGCDGQGLCQFGCPTDAKQSTNVSYIPRALDYGAFLFTGFRVNDLLKQNNAIQGVKACGHNREGKRITLTIRARRTILAMGTFFTPNFLRAQGVRNTHLGNNLTIHPAGAALGWFPDRDFNHAQRIPQGFGLHDLAEEGINFEGGTVPFVGHGLMNPLQGRDFMRFTERYQQTAYFGFMLQDSSRGRVRPGPHRDIPFIWYAMNQHDLKQFKYATGLLARMYFRAGAQEVILPGLRRITTLHNEAELDAHMKKNLKAHDFMATAWHPLGTARLGSHQDDGVIDSQHQVFGYDNLYVMDGSAIRGPLGVNPQVTIMATATRAARRMAKTLME